jgi:signal peptidase II
VLGEFLKLNFIRNPGAAFSTGSGYTALITVLAVVITVVIFRTARKLGSLWWAVLLGGMLGGAVGNLVDRFLRSPGVLRGHVVDFLQLPHWAIFNVADMAVVGSAIGMVLLSIMGYNLDGTRERKQKDD